jgi:hypothetical protein
MPITASINPHPETENQSQTTAPHPEEMNATPPALQRDQPRRSVPKRSGGVFVCAESELKKEPRIRGSKLVWDLFCENRSTPSC